MEDVRMYTIDTKSQASAAWMEHEILNHVKQALRVTLGWKVPREGVSRKLSSIHFTLKSFQRHLERLMNIEEQDGYMAFVEEIKPNMHFRIDQLEHDHDRFRRTLNALLPKVEALNENESDSEEIKSTCGEVYDLLDEVDHHDKQEIALLQDSLWCDEGGEG
jgi:iron-sulfur cluster repair protein YtfE (RIC family)